MIRKLKLHQYRSVEECELEFRPLTLLTGLNSVGKSTSFQAILTGLYYASPEARMWLGKFDFSFEALRNRYTNAKEWSVTLEGDGMEMHCLNMMEGAASAAVSGLELEKNLYYLSANRLGFDEMEKMSSQCKVGLAGEYIFGTFEQEKSKPVAEGLRVCPESDTLSYHFNYWLSHILGIPFEMQTERVTSSLVKVSYKSDDLPGLSPAQLGVGVSYLAKVLLMCLRAETGNVLMIENPEIHLHPAAQARLGEFLVYVAKAGIQLLVETHCEHLINRIQYEVFKKHISHGDVILYYKDSIGGDYLPVSFTEEGKYVEEFPAGFFDATLDELLQIE